MSDLVERLRYWTVFNSGPLCIKAADALEAQAKRIAELEAALVKITALNDDAECCGNGRDCGHENPPECCDQPIYGLDRAKLIARAALKEGKPNG